SICLAASCPIAEKKLSGSLIAAYCCGSHRAQCLRAIAPYLFTVVFSLLLLCQLQQVLEAELAFDVLEVIPAPLRYHRWLTPAPSAGPDQDGATSPPGRRWPLLTSRGIVGIPFHYGQLKLKNDLHI